ncbi:hypothetical protein FQZ97_834420 [compost metagenome]
MPGGIELAQVALRQAVKTQQQVVETLFQVRPGAVDQGLDVFRLVVERRQDGETHVQVGRAHHPPGFLDHRGGGAVGELRVERRQGHLLDALRRQTLQRRLDRRLAVTHRQLDRTLGPLRLHGRLQAPAQHHQRRAVRPPDRRIGMGRGRGALEQNQRHQQTPQRPGQVDHIGVHQKLIEIAPYISHFGRRRGAQVDQQQGVIAHAESLSVSVAPADPPGPYPDR